VILVVVVMGRKLSGEGREKEKAASINFLLWKKKKKAKSLINSTPLKKIMSTLVPLPKSIPAFLAPYLPTGAEPFHVTLTYAASIDSRIAAAPGTQTAISHLETKTMTHYIRAHHDAILVGIGTVLADDPGLNCRWKPLPSDPVHFIRPVIIDPAFKWKPQGSRLIRNCQEKTGLAPYVVIANTHGLTQEQHQNIKVITDHGGKVLPLPVDSAGQIAWSAIFTALQATELRSVMVEGGARVINRLLLEPELVASLIVTIGPIYLGAAGVEVSPARRCRLQSVQWWSGTQDSVLAAHLEGYPVQVLPT
jgi:2,5-diamino-6-(ribosylamino)-4(3H)-pyrimidinone 5'-phosphate reductase